MDEEKKSLHDVSRPIQLKHLDCSGFNPHTIHDRFWQLATDSLPPLDAATLSEDLGIELDTTEHSALERTELSSKMANPLKRKR